MAGWTNVETGYCLVKELWLTIIVSIKDLIRADSIQRYSHPTNVQLYTKSFTFWIQLHKTAKMCCDNRYAEYSLKTDIISVVCRIRSESSSHIFTTISQPTKLWLMIFLPGTFAHMSLIGTLDYHLISAMATFFLLWERIENWWIVFYPNHSAYTELHTFTQKHYYLRKQISIELITDSNEARIINTFNTLQNPNLLGCPQENKCHNALQGSRKLHQLLPDKNLGSIWSHTRKVCHYD